MRGKRKAMARNEFDQWNMFGNNSTYFTAIQRHGR